MYVDVASQTNKGETNVHRDTKIDETIETGYYYLCLIAKSKAQAKSILTQTNQNPAEYEIIEIKENKMEQKFTISKLKEYISAIKTMGFDEETSEVRISYGIIYIDDKKNNKSATIVEKMLSITMYDTITNEKGEQNV